MGGCVCSDQTRRLRNLAAYVQNPVPFLLSLGNLDKYLSLCKLSFSHRQTGDRQTLLNSGH